MESWLDAAEAVDKTLAHLSAIELAATLKVRKHRVTDGAVLQTYFRSVSYFNTSRFFALTACPRPSVHFPVMRMHAEVKRMHARSGTMHYKHDQA